MKLKVIFGIAVVVGVVVIVYLFSKNVHELHHEYHRSVPYDTQKINELGEYQPFHGYTIVAMIDPSLALLAERIEDFLGTSRLGENYSPLPASTYHMTIYSIYQCGNQMIPPVERWMNASGATVSNSAWLPAEVLQEQNEKAMCIIDKYLKEPLRVKFANLLVNQRAIKLSLEMDDESLERIRNARREFAKIYEDRDWSMEPINEKLHVQLAYVYAPTDQPNWEESNQLNEWGMAFNGQQFQLPSVYLFDSMINYVPYQRRKHEIEC